MAIRVLFTFLALCILTACAQGHCRRVTAAAPEVKSPSGGDVALKSGEARIFVYKYDGSLQCGAGKAQSLDAMAKQLKGIPVFSKVKKRDGLMHIQVCGSITGMANVYEIPAAKLKEAEAMGFKKWSFE